MTDLLIIKGFLVSLLMTSALAKQQLWIEYSYAQPDVFQRYFHRIRDGYFVDLGGFNPIAYSNTVKLSNWKGLIVEANQQRAGHLRDFESNIQTLNFAVFNVTSDYTTFFEADFSVASTLNVAALGDLTYKQIKTMTIGIADLCHKYYKTRPKLMNIDLEGVGESVLRANDWKTEKCVPQIIFAEDFAVNQRTGQINTVSYLVSINYTMFEHVGINKVFIHNSVLAFYQKEVEANNDYVTNHEVVQWDHISPSFAKLLGKPFDPIYIPSTNPAYVLIRQPSIINIVEINKYSNSISKVGPNRPILIFEYDRELSSIYVGGKYNVQQIKVDKYEFKKITTEIDGSQLLVYVFNHYKYSDFKLSILQSSPISTNVGGQYQLISQNVHYLLIITVFSTNILFLIIFFLVRRCYSKKFKGTHLQSQQADSPASNQI